MNTLSSWTVYEKPLDYPDKYVARLWYTNAHGIFHTNRIVIGDSLEAVRAQMPAGMRPIPRWPGDEPQIVEIWL